jgi:hypothetical protein
MKTIEEKVLVKEGRFLSCEWADRFVRDRVRRLAVMRMAVSCLAHAPKGLNISSTLSL